MINLYEKNIQKQKEVIEELEKLRIADQAVIYSQKQHIHFLEEKISLLEKEKQGLTDTFDNRIRTKIPGKNFLQDLTIPPIITPQKMQPESTKEKTPRQCASEVKRAGITFVMAYP